MVYIYILSFIAGCSFFCFFKMQNEILLIIVMVQKILGSYQRDLEQDSLVVEL